MSTTLTIELPDALARDLAAVAARSGQPVEQWAASQLAVAVEEHPLAPPNAGPRDTPLHPHAPESDADFPALSDLGAGLRQPPPLPAGLTERVLGLHAGPGYWMSADFNELDEDFASVNG